jgi:arsenate reductase
VSAKGEGENMSAGEIVLLHNPRCSKSRQAKEILEKAGVDFVERKYLDEPLSKKELVELKTKLGRPVHEWMRSKDAGFKEAGLSTELAEAKLIDAMVQQPALMERPIVIRGEKAVVGRPPEDIKSLL